MDSLREIISDLHVFMYGGMRALPITLAGTIVILGLFTANYAMMFFLAGFIIITPMLSAILNKIVDALVLFLANNGGYNINFFKTKTSDICNVVIPYSTLTKPSKAEDQNILCTTSFAMICFFLGYMLTNAVSIYGRKSDPSADPTKVSNRKSHAVLSIASISVFAMIVILFRLYADCEPAYVGIISGIIIFGLLGKGWYHMLGDHNEGRLADLFGISNRILPSSATNDQPVACVLDPNA
jgi:hypothetical protein